MQRRGQNENDRQDKTMCPSIFDLGGIKILVRSNPSNYVVKIGKRDHKIVYHVGRNFGQDLILTLNGVS